MNGLNFPKTKKEDYLDAFSMGIYTLVPKIRKDIPRIGDKLHWVGWYYAISRTQPFHVKFVCKLKGMFHHYFNFLYQIKTWIINLRLKIQRRLR